MSGYGRMGGCAVVPSQQDPILSKYLHPQVTLRLNLSILIKWSHDMKQLKLQHGGLIIFVYDPEKLQQRIGVSIAQR